MFYSVKQRLLDNVSITKILTKTTETKPTQFITSGDSKGGPGWAMAPQIFAWPPVWPPQFFS